MALYQSQIDIEQHMHGHALDFTYKNLHPLAHMPPTTTLKYTLSFHACFKSNVSVSSNEVPLFYLTWVILLSCAGASA